MTFPAKSEASFSFHQPAMVLDFFEKEFKEHEYDYRWINPQTLKAELDWGVYLITGKDDNVTIELACQNDEVLADVREGISHHFAELNDNIKLYWSGRFNVGAMPENFVLGKVVASERIGKSFQRITIFTDHIERFTKKGLHFRLCRSAKPGQQTLWPTISETGTTVWPKGDNALIDKVYTTRKIDLKNQLLIADIFVHEGGLTCEWASTNPVGETVGLWGPGGGWFPEGDEIFMAGDETALPMILRSLEELPSATKGTANILVYSSEDILDVQNQTQMQLTWLFRTKDDNLVDWVSQNTPNGSEHSFHWFASNQQEAKAVRKIFTADKGVNKRRMYCAAYWH